MSDCTNHGVSVLLPRHATSSLLKLSEKKAFIYDDVNLISFARLYLVSLKEMFCKALQLSGAPLKVRFSNVSSIKLMRVSRTKIRLQVC